MLSASVSLSYVAGNDITLEFAVTDEDDVVAIITGSTVFFAAARAGEAAALSTEDLTAVGTITNGAGGIFQVAIAAANTVDLLGTYRFQAKLEDSSGDMATVARGFMTFEPDLNAGAS